MLKMVSSETNYTDTPMQNDTDADTEMEEEHIEQVPEVAMEIDGPPKLAPIQAVKLQSKFKLIRG